MSILGISTSKKLSMAIAGVLAVLLQDVIGLTPDATAEIVKLLMVYIGGQGVVDISKAIASRPKIGG